MKHITDCLQVMADFFEYVETQFKKKVQMIRSDNAPELCQGLMRNLLLNKGIVNQTSCSHTPQQNGVVERKHRFLLETARALSFQFNVPAMY